MTALRATSHAEYTAPAPAKTIVIPAGAVVGDLIILSWSGGAAPTLDASFTGWTQLASAGGFGGVVWWRLCQAGDPGRTVTVEAGAGATKVSLMMTVLSAVDQVSPIAVSNTTSETTSLLAHVGPTLAMGGVTGKVLQIYLSKEPNASSARSSSGAYTEVDDRTNGSATQAQVSVHTLSNADVTGSQSALTWTIDQPSANAFMVAIGVTPVSTTVGVFPQSDVTLPSGAVIVGGTTATQVVSDTDDNTYVQFGVSGTPQHLILRFGSGGTPLQGPLQTLTMRLLLNGATSVVVVPTLRNATVPLSGGGVQSSHNFTADGTFTWTISSGDQTAQTNLADIEADFSITGS